MHNIFKDALKPVTPKEDQAARIARLRAACAAARMWINHDPSCAAVADASLIYPGDTRCDCDQEAVKAMLDAVLAENP